MSEYVSRYFRIYRYLLNREMLYLRKYINSTRRTLIFDSSRKRNLFNISLQNYHSVSCFSFFICVWNLQSVTRRNAIVVLLGCVQRESRDNVNFIQQLVVYR